MAFVPVEHDRGHAVLTDLARLRGQRVALTGPAPDAVRQRLAELGARPQQSFTTGVFALAYDRLHTTPAQLAAAASRGIALLPYDNLADTDPD